MVYRAHIISSTFEIFNEECARLRSIFCQLDYPIGLINSTIRSVASKLSTNTVNLNQVKETATIRISLPYKEQRAADTVRKQMCDLSNKIGLSIQPVFISRKLEQDLKLKETKPSIVNKQCVVYLLHFPKGKCHKSPVFCRVCRFRRREMEFPSAHRRLKNYVHLWISMDNICFSQYVHLWITYVSFS
jgi:hypothetical protein